MAQKKGSVQPSLKDSSTGPLGGETLWNPTSVQVAAASRRPGWNAPLPGQLPLPGEGFGVGGGGGSVSRKPDAPIVPDHDLHEETGEDERGPNPGIGHNSKVAPDPSEIQSDGERFKKNDPPSDEPLGPAEEKPVQDEDQNEDPEKPEEDNNQPPSTGDRDFRQTPPDNYGSILGELPSFSAHGKKSRNKPPGPHPDAAGKPHKIIEKPGRDGQYTVHWGDGSGFQYRGSGKPHGNTPRPNVKVFGSRSREGVLHSYKKIREPFEDEIPKE